MEEYNKSNHDQEVGHAMYQPVDLGKQELGWHGVAPPFGQMLVYDQRN